MTLYRNAGSMQPSGCRGSESALIIYSPIMFGAALAAAYRLWVHQLPLLSCCQLHFVCVPECRPSAGLQGAAWQSWWGGAP